MKVNKVIDAKERGEDVKFKSSSITLEQSESLLAKSLIK